LKNIALDIPHGQLLSICGVSGCGKSSLAFDTLYAEGQRRYMESLSPYTRQFLEQLDKPDADSIEGIPPAIAVRASRGLVGARTTVGTATEINAFLRQLFTSASLVVCTNCGSEVAKHSPDSVARYISGIPGGTRIQLGFATPLEQDTDMAELLQSLKKQGFKRVIVGERLLNLDSIPSPLPIKDVAPEVWTIVDRLVAGSTKMERIRDSLQTAFDSGKGSIFVRTPADDGVSSTTIDGQPWSTMRFHRRLICGRCGISYPDPQPGLFSFGSALGACATCEGFGSVHRIDIERIVPDKSKSIAQGAIVPWNTPAYRHELQELLDLAADYDLPVDIPFDQLSDRHQALIWDGVKERDFGGLSGFFAWLERKKYKMHIRVFLSRWRTYDPCPDCRGTRFNSQALAFRFGGKNLAEILGLEIQQAIEFFSSLKLTQAVQQTSRRAVREITDRLGYLQQVGLAYLTLDRSIRTLSGGESQRVALTSSLGSTLVNMLYVLDEPSVGLHAHDVTRLADSVRQLNQRGNTVVVVDHEEAMIQSAERVVEIGPDAGAGGGEITFDGSVDQLRAADASLTGDFIMHRRGLRNLQRPRRKPQSRIKLTGASGNNLQSIDVEIPLNCLCVVTGVSGSGKSSLVQKTLYGALCQRKNQNCDRPLPYQSVIGEGLIDEVVLIDSTPVGRSPRSNPVTYVKAFDEIRASFAETLDAKTRNLKASHFSFNVDGGRCSKCHGAGQLVVDMQFLSDVYVTCDQCRGTRFRDEVLSVRYRGKNIHEVLKLTVREAFPFFRGRPKVQTRLKALIDVGLDYVCLGQPTTTLSSGESQRLKLAHYLNAPKSRRALFILNEPTTGLHMRDVVKLVDCFDVLTNAGHSMIVVEHNLHLIKHADWIIDLGPGAAGNGGSVVAAGTPEAIANCPDSITGKYLAELFYAEANAVGA
jgi:excinuclease ABC subunit A